MNKIYKNKKILSVILKFDPISETRDPYIPTVGPSGFGKSKHVWTQTVILGSVSKRIQAVLNQE
jgi:hypothetical protein